MTDELLNDIIDKLNIIWRNVCIHIVNLDNKIAVRYIVTSNDDSIDTVLRWPSLKSMLIKSNDSRPFTIFELLRSFGDKLTLNTYNKIKFLECSSIEELQVKLDLVAI